MAIYEKPVKLSFKDMIEELSIKKSDRNFAHDLYSLLVKKNHRDYIGITIFEDVQAHLKAIKAIFFDSKSP